MYQNALCSIVRNSSICSKLTVTLLWEVSSSGFFLAHTMSHHSPIWVAAVARRLCPLPTILGPGTTPSFGSLESSPTSRLHMRGSLCARLKMVPSLPLPHHCPEPTCGNTHLQENLDNVAHLGTQEEEDNREDGEHQHLPWPVSYSRDLGISNWKTKENNFSWGKHAHV